MKELYVKLGHVFPYLAVIFMWVVLADRCKKLDQADFKNHELKAKAEQSKILAEEALRKKDSLAGKLAIYDGHIIKLNESIKSKEAQIADLKKQGSGKKAEVEKYVSSDFAKYFNDRYDSDKVITQEEAIRVPDTISKFIVNDLITGDVAKEANAILSGIIVDERSKLAVKDNIIENYKGQNNSFAEAVKELKNAGAAQDDIIKNNEKTIKNQAKANTALKIGIPAAFILGFLIAK